jgi:hypothetical protein
MAFANRRAWVEPAHVEMIFADDGYREVEVAAVMPGDVVLYRDTQGNVSHVAVVVSHERDLANARWRTQVLSQWGADGEYFHDPRDVNQWLGKPDKFYRIERRGGVEIMTLQEVMSSIESHRFAAEVNMASGSSMFYQGLRNHHLFQ